LREIFVQKMKITKNGTGAQYLQVKVGHWFLVTSSSAVTTSDAIYRRTGGDRWPVCLPPL